jgi:hypothetical protein
MLESKNPISNIEKGYVKTCRTSKLKVKHQRQAKIRIS